jgi:hypothetical protein
MQKVTIKHLFDKGETVFVVREAGVFKGKVTGIDWEYVEKDPKDRVDVVAELYIAYTLDIISSGSLLADYDKEINEVAEENLFKTKKEAIAHITQTIENVKTMREEADILDDKADALEESVGIRHYYDASTSTSSTMDYSDSLTETLMRKY